MSLTWRRYTRGDQPDVAAAFSPGWLVAHFEAVDAHDHIWFRAWTKHGCVHLYRAHNVPFPAERWTTENGDMTDYLHVCEIDTFAQEMLALGALMRREGADEDGIPLTSTLEPTTIIPTPDERGGIITISGVVIHKAGSVQHLLEQIGLAATMRVVRDVPVASGYASEGTAPDREITLLGSDGRFPLAAPVIPHVTLHVRHDRYTDGLGTVIDERQTVVEVRPYIKRT